MESTLCSDNEVSLRPPKIIIKQSLARPDRSLTPTLFYEKSFDKLPPIKQMQNPSLNKTPPPNTRTLNLIHSTTRIKSIVHSSIFPNLPSKKLDRAPSVNDLLPPLTRISSIKQVKCGLCGKESQISNDLHLNEFKIWKTCSHCQDVVFTTNSEHELFDAITFSASGEFNEFALEAKIQFWMEGQLWTSVQECVEKLGKGKVYKANYQKVKQHPRLEQLLRNTGNKELIYFMPGNKYWGVSFNGIGGNRLGKILMDIRSELCN